jgi:hypothetical protein
MTRVFHRGLVALATPAVAEPIEPSDIRVVDGDTIHINNPKVGAPPGPGEMINAANEGRILGAQPLGKTR